MFNIIEKIAMIDAMAFLFVVLFMCALGLISDYLSLIVPKKVYGVLSLILLLFGFIEFACITVIIILR